MIDSKKIANNMLELLFDPTVIPVEKRLYFRPEERLQNEDFAKAKAEAYKSFGDQRHNSDFYPKNIQREASIMDRKTIIASLDVLSQNFDESDPIGTDLRTMAYAVSNMSDEELVERMAKKKMEMITCPKCGNPHVVKQMGYCLKCKTKGIGKGAAEEKKVCKACGEEDCVCANKEAKLNLKTIQDAIKGLSPQEAKQVAQAYKEQKGKKLASDVIAKLGLGGKALVALAALMALAGSAMAGDKAEADTLADTLSKGDMTSIELPKENFTLPLLASADRIMQSLEQTQDVKTPAGPEKLPGAGGTTLDLSKDATDFWSKEAAEAVQQAILSDVLPDAVVAKKKAPKAPAVPEKAVEEVPAAEPAVMAKEEEKTTPAPEVKEAKEEVTTTPAPEVKEEPKEAQVVDTHILAYDGIELGEGNNMDDVVLTADDKAQLDQLFK
jgi:outer membrane biosynthesis protein TonB